MLLPALIFLSAGGLLAYAGRASLLPATEVMVSPVVARPAAPGAAPSRGAGPAAVTVQAPGWIEPDPFPTIVPALTEGVIREVLVLEGQRVEAGQVVARMIDADAVLSERSARQALAQRAAECRRAGAALDAARAAEAAEIAAADELRDEITRKTRLVDSGSVTEAEMTRLHLRLRGQEARVTGAHAAIAEAEASVAEAAAASDQAQTALDGAALALERTEVRAPSAGVVLSRLAEPGSRMMISGNDPAGAVVLRLYDPSRLQVRVDIPLADAAKVGADQEAEIVSEAIPDRPFRGRVTRLVHEANIQKNTVQVKVGIRDPSPQLKPEMLTRVRFFTPGRAGESEGGAPSGGAGAAGLRLFAPAGSIVQQAGAAPFAWVFDEAGSRATRRDLVLTGAAVDGWREVAEGLRAGDSVIVDPPPGLTEGAKVRPSTAGAGERRSR